MLVTCRRLVRLSYALSRLKFAIFYYLYNVHFPHCGSKHMNPVYDVLFTSHVIGGLYVRILSGNEYILFVALSCQCVCVCVFSKLCYHSCVVFSKNKTLFRKLNLRPSCVFSITVSLQTPSLMVNADTCTPYIVPGFKLTSSVLSVSWVIVFTVQMVKAACACSL